MTNIIIYTTEANLIHKKGLKKGEEEIVMFYWKFSKLPIRFGFGEKIYFATKGFIKGFFVVSEIYKRANHYAEVPENSVAWRCDSWTDIKPIPTKSFQGFKYADKVEGLE